MIREFATWQEYRRQFNRDAHDVMGMSGANLWRQYKTGVFAGTELQNQMDTVIENLMRASISQKHKPHLSMFNLFRFRLMDRVASFTRRLFPQKEVPIEW